MKILLVDDEALARERLHRLLSRQAMGRSPWFTPSARPRT